MIKIKEVAEQYRGKRLLMSERLKSWTEELDLKVEPAGMLTAADEYRLMLRLSVNYVTPHATKDFAYNEALRSMHYHLYGEIQARIAEIMNNCSDITTREELIELLGDIDQ